jgi:hypothetical protein
MGLLYLFTFTLALSIIIIIIIIIIIQVEERYGRKVGTPLNNTERIALCNDTWWG